ncbi:MAG: nucleoside hydrolase-like domain-containing protein [Saprospiraceae bacterium]
MIYTILDQDATYKKYIASHWPDIKIIYNSRQFGCLAYNWKKVIPDSIQYLFEGKYMSENIIHNHGPLLDEYYSYGDGKHQEGDDEHIHGDPTKIKNSHWGSFDKYDFISEGDSPAFLYLVNVGLANLYHPELGGWGGRFVQSSTIKSRWEDGSNASDQSSESFPQVRWLEAIQNDMAARADWCVEDYKHANHAPVIVLKQKSLVHIGKKLKQSLKASAIDPDGNKLNYKWWYYPEAGNYQGKVRIINTNRKTSKIELDKKLEKNESIHMIVEVIDNGIHPMTRYQRVVLTY